ncbi:hypothetical protein Nepgr_007789 [Nepenthes gracilis]|uniref:Uncharacterized protein n=1 Tax=Nepenthes gracilis TaxID=150966 RepID=A0AAD3S7X1_NEPGR|nr:hypothetical protein Nepgr_007789 [Nepenthes gracilis]
MDRLLYARVCVEVKNDAVLPSKIILSKCSTFKAESVVDVEVELPGKQLSSDPKDAQCQPQSVSCPLGRNLDSGVKFVHPPKDKIIALQLNSPGIGAEHDHPMTVLRPLIPCVDQLVLSPDLGRICIETSVCSGDKDPHFKPLESGVRSASVVPSIEAPNCDSLSRMMAPYSIDSHSDHGLVKQLALASGTFGVVVELSSQQALLEMAEGVVAGSSQVSLTEFGVGCCHASARFMEPVFAPTQSSSDCNCLLPSLDPNNCKHQPLLDAHLCPQAGVGDEALLAGDK